MWRVSAAELLLEYSGHLTDVEKSVGDYSQWNNVTADYSSESGLFWKCVTNGACSNYRVSLIQDVTRYYYFYEKCDGEDIHMNFIFYLFIDQEWFLVVLCVVQTVFF